MRKTNYTNGFSIKIHIGNTSGGGTKTYSVNQGQRQRTPVSDSLRSSCRDYSRIVRGGAQVNHPSPIGAGVGASPPLRDTSPASAGGLVVLAWSEREGGTLDPLPRLNSC